MMCKMFIVCLSAAFLLVSLEETTAKNIQREQLSRSLARRSDRVRRAGGNEEIISWVEDLLAGNEEPPKDKVSPVEPVQCGRAEVQPTPLLTFGSPTEKGKWPWHAALYHVDESVHAYKCGGSLVGRRTVITAAHCVKDAVGHTLNPDIMIVYLGKYHLKFWTGTQEMQVAEIVVHPDYSVEKFTSDIAILILSSPVEYTSLVRPVCLWDKNQVVEKGTPGTVIGWGRNEIGKVTGELMMAHMPIVSDLACIKSYPEFFGKILNEKNFCAGYRNGTSACNGDSGGGMVFPAIYTSNRVQTWYLRGVVSLGPGVNGLCDPEHYVIFTDVGEYLDWINQYLR